MMFRAPAESSRRGRKRRGEAPIVVPVTVGSLVPVAEEMTANVRIFAFVLRERFDARLVLTGCSTGRCHDK